MKETSSHVLSGCQKLLPLYTERHNDVQDALVHCLETAGVVCSVRQRVEVDGQVLIPDVTLPDGSVIDVTCPTDTIESFDRAHADKVAKYRVISSRVLPLVVGANGSWSLANDDIRRHLKIGSRLWRAASAAMRKAAIEGTTKAVVQFFGAS